MSGAKGLICRRCECRDFRVIYTRPSPAGYIVRRRACRHCGWEVTTRELTVEKVGELHKCNNQSSLTEKVLRTDAASDTKRTDRDP